MSSNLRLDILIHELFVLPADSDYLLARFSALNRVYSSFFWAALQTIEKLIKANLLHKGCSVKRFGHDLAALSVELRTYDPDILDFELHPHERHREIFNIIDWGSTIVEDFISIVNLNGDASSRYNYYGYDFNSSYLLKLDQIVHRLRGNATGVEVFHDIRMTAEAKHNAFEDNMPFAPSDYMQGSIWGKFGVGSSVPEIEMALKGKLGHEGEYESWLKRNIKIKNDEIVRIRSR